MTAFVVCLFVLLLAAAAARPAHMLGAIRALRARRREMRDIDENLATLRITVIVPCRNAGESVRDAINWFSDMAVPRAMSVTYIFVCSANDTLSPSTFEVAHQYLDRVGTRPLCVVCKAPAHATTKAAQVAHVLERANILADCQHFIAIYDHDSRPDPDTFVWFARLSFRHEILIGQQPSLYVPSAWSSVAAAEAYGQSAWTLSYEVPNWLANERRPHTLHYCVSHGLFIRADVVKAYPLPSNTRVEDLLYGYCLFCRGLVPILVPAFDSVDVPSSVRTLMSQKAKWFAGSLHALQATWHSAPRSLPRVRRLAMDLWWLCGYTLWCAVAAALACYASTSVAASLVICAYILHWIVPLLLLGTTHDMWCGTPARHRRESFATRVAVGLIYYGLFNLGPALGLAKAVVAGSFERAANSAGQTIMGSVASREAGHSQCRS